MSSHYCPKCGRFKRESAPLCDRCTIPIEQDIIAEQIVIDEEHKCPRCGRFKSSYFPVCDRCTKFENTEYTASQDNRYCPICGRIKLVYAPLCDTCKMKELINAMEYELPLKNTHTSSKNAKQEKQQTKRKSKSYKRHNDFHEKYDDRNIYKCKCGICVKSKDERSIADFLFENNIPFEYEKESQYFEYNAQWDNLKVKTIHPDFFIKGPINFQGKRIENVYIEYWGLNTPEYLEIKAYKFKVYKHNNCTLINLYPEDIYDCEGSLTKKLTEFKDRQINF